MEELISAFERIIKLLENSEDSIWANYTVDEAKEILQTELVNYKQTQKLSDSGKSRINFLFLPTSALQEISMDNGWGDQYVEISNIFDKYL
ncbi:MAG: hypothetical protein LUM44_21540 [Pyrinomonadaceae bacterium]|nr:hypothetical protein [Pyrinomonadaceae bacterium]